MVDEKGIINVMNASVGSVQKHVLHHSGGYACRRDLSGNLTTSRGDGKRVCYDRCRL
ncbi:hypothetical protein BD311DRAFT_753359 [Dichomitus squalens]|uniref:Uncharacterized protein n=1 Tax=Dichomitus squalens TaxID=114155 RepID=A0A4Q9MX70_9APHY|nr:hypothetical protein BD311DRAFT_753359 [Dichomitus squalens]